jgi:hypothetical protein
LEPQRQKDKKTRKKPMGIAEEKDTEGAVAKEVENQTNEPIIFHLCFVKFFLQQMCFVKLCPPLDFVPCSVTGGLHSSWGLEKLPVNYPYESSSQSTSD